MHAAVLPFEQFPALAALPDIRHGFTTRVPDIDVAADKAAALQRLDAIHRKIRREIGAGDMTFATAEQVHDNRIAVVTGESGDTCAEGCDGLVTNRPGVCLGIYVADCCAVYLVDPVKRAIGLVHSGRKGTELEIAGRAIDVMAENFGSDPRDLVAQLSPCIRPPHYEVDFAAAIRSQCADRGVQKISDAGTCTACDLAKYYSYRAEKGRTGRMLALLALAV